MAKEATRLTSTRESAWADAIGGMGGGIVVMLVSGILMYFVKFLAPNTLLMAIGYSITGAGILLGAGLVVRATYRATHAKELKGLSVSCPYCKQPNPFLTPPTEDYDCEHCLRTVHFENGRPVEIRTLACPQCRAEHLVPVNALRYVCDKCNRPLPLDVLFNRQPVNVQVTAPMTAVDERADEMFQNYDVLLIGVDPRREEETLQKVQNLLVINLHEAKNLVASLSPKNPLIVGYDVSQRKAEILRRQLQELGATATIRPTNAYHAPSQRT